MKPQSRQCRPLAKKDAQFALYMTWVTQTQIEEVKEHINEQNKDGVVREAVDAIIVLKELISGLDYDFEEAIINRVKNRYSAQTHKIVRKYVDKFMHATKEDGRYEGTFCFDCKKIKV